SNRRACRSPVCPAGPSWACATGSSTSPTPCGGYAPMATSCRTACSLRVPSTLPPNLRCRCGISPHSTSSCARRGARSPIWPLHHSLPGSAVLSFGTAGCNLACKFCQNWDISKSRETDTLADRATPAHLARVADEIGCRSVAFTYNDPTIFWEYAADVADAC